MLDYRRIKDKKFICPICRSKRKVYFKVAMKDPFKKAVAGKPINLISLYYACGGCTVHFSDPRKFCR